ncbi:TIGR03089 family protein [Frankia sp. CcI156]|uniref:TIGR03089 family protein n=1 Tax=Frankia casuarinae (strain DSM 45818 / CECT 9043 / HFP020203 / CcI3) TaxID=106370 RepID=Q2JF48_FRACC|nr:MULTISPECIES: TIGR03089 family protein [Frankia]ABD10094.1 conserved hypothetical protein [Frankia casuarinae]ETA04118.1 hypothetical protein CcI6DRAFT_00333 [Frankia sp. CcI6]EYT94037.1 hypothetical protein ThrDRAFT_00408 [Frankia casuarinae]KDA44662.1 hypothetical protein BMG523Draft_00512 [Frankia sp. BMG5.23]KEZ38534.1 TIGR03089 family protein [Frankia sp. CeD]
MSASVPRLVAARTLLGPAADADAAPAAGVRGIASVLAHRLATDPARPLVTFYDDATGERVEFSATTFDNWVAKTANMLVDTLGLGIGDRVGVHLPTHWLSSVILLATWSAGMDAVLVRDAAGEQDGGDAEKAGGELPVATPLDALFVAEDRLDEAFGLMVDEIVALSLRPLGGRMRRPVAGVLDYAAEVPPHGDRFAAPAAPPGQAALLRAGTAIAGAWGLGPADRVLFTAPLATTEGLVGSLLAPLVAGSSIVLCRHLDSAALPRRIETEKITAVGRSVLRHAPSPLPAGVRSLPLPRLG